MPLDRLHDWMKGERPAAAHLNSTNRAAERLGRLTVGPGLELQDGPTGRHIALGRRQTIPALLSGSASPYSWAEAYRSGGAWVALPGGRTGTASAVEVNEKPNLGGKVALLRLCGVGPAGDAEWCFQFLDRGPAGCVATYHVTVTDAATGGPISGATVTISRSYQDPVTGTTDAAGVVDLVVHLEGTWTITATRNGYSSGSTTAVAVCGATTDVGLSLAGGIAVNCCPTDPVPATLYATDDYGTMTLAWNGTDAWIGCQADSNPNAYADTGFSCTNFGPQPVPRRYRLTCTLEGSYNFQLELVYPRCKPASNQTRPIYQESCGNAPWTAGNVGLLFRQTANTPRCSPLSLDFAFSPTTCPFFAGGTGHVTVSS